MARAILLTQWHAPGDTICSTAAVRDLALTFPGEFETHIAGACAAVWQNNPHIARFWGSRYPRGMPRVELSYRVALESANRVRLHFLTAFHRVLEQHLQITLPVLRPAGDLHLPHSESSCPLVPGRYWLLVAGGTDEIRTKIWPAAYSQQVVWQLAKHGIRIVQMGARYAGHQHPTLDGVVSLVGQTSLREALQLVYHADGVICPVTFAMHAAAAFDKPCVVIAGGREPWWWEAYTDSADHHFGPTCPPVRTPHRYLHTIGMLDCCLDGGCWRSDLTERTPPGPHVCMSPTFVKSRGMAPSCLARITPEMVVAAVLSYYRDGTLCRPEPQSSAV